MPPSRSLTNLPPIDDGFAENSNNKSVNFEPTREGYPQTNHRLQHPDWYYQQQRLDSNHHLQQRQLPAEEEANDGLSLNSHKDPLPPSYYIGSTARMDEKSKPPLASMPMPSAGYPPRPPLGHADSTAYSAMGGSNPMLPLSYEAAESGSSASTPGIPGHKLRRPSSTAWMKKEAEGYQELRGPPGQAGTGQRPGMNKRHTTSYSMSPEGSHVVLDETTQKTRLGRVYAYLMTASIVTRWFFFILPMLALLWVPGILGLTKFPHARVWTVGLLWWSIWLSVLWVGWWVALAFARFIPYVIRATIGVVAVSTRRYIDWLQALNRYVALFAWSFAIWGSYQGLILKNQTSRNPDNRSISIINKLLLATVICSGVLLFEKFAIQFIAGKFHERSYAERIADQKYAVKTLVSLYKYSVDTPGRSDTLGHGESTRSFAVQHKRIFRKIRQGVRLATTTTATVFGNVASEIAGSSVLQPNSPQAIIKTALESANKSRLLARRLFYSFAKEGADYMLLEDIERYFSSKEDAISAFTLFDKDGNGDASREEVELACLEFHREQLSIENSMRDLDSAVGRLDNIFMSLYFIIAAIIVAICLDASFTSVLTGAGTLVLGLSWLIGGSLQEVLTSIIFLFIKHPFDVGDRVVVSKETYTVKEIRLLSTIFLDGNNTLVQAPNSQLNTLFIQNIRRSPQMSETFTFDVNYSTTFEDLENLRVKMLEFIHAEKRDFQPAFDVTVKGCIDFPEQTKMTLSADIKYKSNSQQGALKAKRRNKWICALKTILAELKIFGPDGDPNAPPGITRYTNVPWEKIQREEYEAKAKTAQGHADDMHRPTDGWRLGDKNAAILDPADDVFGDSSALHLTNPRRGLSDDNIGTQGSIQRPPGFGAPAAPPPHAAEVFELRQRP
ncbi:Mechanosensitive ion channel-domain-containing protein [Crepidotus variabilis]|uniref:Mechanosensitive ion channel-domain-containing protein n=1 Tax=Crepidotus variabilis TaxID=179855 RepID=A0A9P6EML8_9AGAR|nr:Mechanosensitive ion channel-domain-containing protein [Crepidotus variabilis]